MKYWTLPASVLGLLIIGACASPSPVDVGNISNDRVADAVAKIVALDQDLSTTTSPAIDVESDGAQQWFVKSVSPAGDVFRSDSLTLYLESAFDRATDTCAAGSVEDGGATLIIDMKGEDLLSGDYTFADVECLLEQLAIPEAVHKSMVSTRALDGRQTSDWDGINAEWSYHPDNGLDIILTIDA